MKLGFFALLASFVFSVSAHALSVSFKLDNYGFFTYPQQVEGKTVSSVWVHAGTVMKMKSCMAGESVYWTGTSHFQLTEKANGYFGSKAQLPAYYSETTCEMQEVVGFGIQYWVYFEDGTMTVTKPTIQPLQLHSRRDHVDYTAAILVWWNNVNLSNQTTSLVQTIKTY